MHLEMPRLVHLPKVQAYFGRHSIETIDCQIVDVGKGVVLRDHGEIGTSVEREA